jgi:hypothetical protein
MRKIMNSKSINRTPITNINDIESGKRACLKMGIILIIVPFILTILIIVYNLHYSSELVYAGWALGFMGFEIGIIVHVYTVKSKFLIHLGSRFQVMIFICEVVLFPLTLLGGLL